MGSGRHAGAQAVAAGAAPERGRSSAAGAAPWSKAHDGTQRGRGAGAVALPTPPSPHSPPHCRSTCAPPAQAFEADGFLIRRGLYSAEEAALLSAVCRQQAPRTAEQGGKPTGYFWANPGESTDPASRNVFNAVCYGERMVDALSALLADDVALYHRKVVLKDEQSFVGGAGDLQGNAWAWHQVRSTAARPSWMLTSLCLRRTMATGTTTASSSHTWPAA